MKKLLVLSLFIIIVCVSLNAAPRSFFRKVAWASGDILTDITNTATTSTNPLYTVTADITETAGEVLATGVNPASTIRLYKAGNGTTVPYYAVIFVQLGSFTTPWVAGNHLTLTVTRIDGGAFTTETSTIPTGTGVINLLDPAFVIPAGPPPPGFTLTVESNYAGADILRDGVSTGFTTPHTWQAPADVAPAGTYTVSLGNVLWVTPAYNWTNTADATVRFMGTLTPDPAMTPYPADMAEIHIAHDAVATTYDLTWVAPPAGPMPTGYTLAWNGAPAVDLGNVLTWTTPAIAEGSYVWTVTPYITDPAKGTKLSLAPVKGKVTANNNKGVCTTAVPWHFTISRDPIYTVDVTSTPSGATIWVDNVATQFVTPHQFVLNAGDDATYAVQLTNYDWAPNPAGSNVIVDIAANATVDFQGTYHEIGIVPGFEFIGEPGVTINSVVGNTTVYTTPLAPSVGAIVMTFSGTTTCDLTILVPAGTWYAIAYYNGMWNHGNPFPVVGPGTVVFLNVPFGAKAPVPVIIDPAMDPTLPVELSSFTAVLTAEYFVNLTWVTESETQVLGFNVYRAEDNNIANAVRVNAAIIGAHNTSEQQVYTITDTEVETAHTYYYWLENVDMGGGSALHGPQTVTVTGNPTPVLPEISMLNSAYPNPFRAGQTTNISVSIKANESGTVTVYNILGQAVKTFKVTEGNHTLTWDGKGCGSGIYFYRLNTPSTNTTKKLVIVK